MNRFWCIKFKVQKAGVQNVSTEAEGIHKLTMAFVNTAYEILFTQVNLHL